MVKTDVVIRTIFILVVKKRAFRECNFLVFVSTLIVNKVIVHQLVLLNHIMIYILALYLVAWRVEHHRVVRLLLLLKLMHILIHRNEHRITTRSNSLVVYRLAIALSYDNLGCVLSRSH